MSTSRLLTFLFVIAVALTSGVSASEDLACEDGSFINNMPGGFVGGKSFQSLNMKAADKKGGWEAFEYCPGNGACYERYRYTVFWKKVSQWRAKVCLQLGNEGFAYMVENLSGEQQPSLPVVRFVTRESKKEPWQLLTEHAYGESSFKSNPKTIAWMYEGPPKTVGIQIVSALGEDSFDILVDRAKK